jgi:outer membrane lipoprotein-sorting protein
MRSTVLIGLLAAFSSAVFGQTESDVAHILKRVAEIYGATREYVLEAEATGRGSSVHMRLAFKPPNRYRLEGVGFGDDSAFAEAVIVDDGSTVWFYLPKSNQYTSFPASELTNDAPGDLGDLRPEAVDYAMMSRYRDAGDSSNGAKLLREEALEIAGAKVDCFVIQVPPHRGAAVYLWWIDKKSNRILREDHAGSSSLFTTITLSEPVPDSLFIFTPPPNAKKIERQP